MRVDLALMACLTVLCALFRIFDEVFVSFYRA